MELVAFVSSSPPQLEMIFSGGKRVMKTSFFCDLHPTVFRASSSKFLIIGWAKVTKQREEVSLDIPDPFCMYFPFVLVFVLICYKWAQVFSWCLPLGRVFLPVMILWESPALELCVSW